MMNALKNLMGKLADKENENSISLTRSLTDKIIHQDKDGEIDQEETNDIRKRISGERHRN